MKYVFFILLIIADVLALLRHIEKRNIDTRAAFVAFSLCIYLMIVYIL